MTSPNAYTLRAARLDELPQIRALESAAGILFQGTSEDWIVDDNGQSLEAYAAWWRAGRIIVAVDADDNPVGFAAVAPVDGQGYLHEIDVHPDHGRRGLGRRLIAASCDWAREQGYTALWLSTFRHIPWNAPYYASLGFRELSEAELGPGLLAQRRHEGEVGLNLAERVFMGREV